jgi:hypothetical protein
MSNLDQQVASTYQPVIDVLNQQVITANDRYAKNKADITNIFGKLSSLSATDAARINDQFVKTIADQQAGLAQRTAEVRTQQQTAAQGQAQVGTDRGNGPAGGPSQVDVTAQQGVNQSNEYQTTWEALMNANKMQAQQDASNANLSYGQQQNTALTGLQRNLEAKLADISGNTASVQSDIAKAKLAANQNLMGLQYQSQNDAANRANDLAVAQARANATLGAAQIHSNKPSTTKSIQQWTNDVESLGAGTSVTLIKKIGAMYRYLKSHGTGTTVSGIGGSVTTKEPSKAALIQMFNQQFGNSAVAPYGVEYINKYFG